MTGTVIVGPYQRIVGFNWPTDPTEYLYLVASFREDLSSQSETFFGDNPGNIRDEELPLNYTAFNSYRTGTWTLELDPAADPDFPFALNIPYDVNGAMLDAESIDLSQLSVAASPAFPVSLSASSTILKGVYFSRGLGYTYAPYRLAMVNNGSALTGLPGELASVTFYNSPPTMRLSGIAADGEVKFWDNPSVAILAYQTMAIPYGVDYTVVNSTNITGTVTYKGLPWEIIGYRATTDVFQDASNSWPFYFSVGLLAKKPSSSA